MSQSSWRHCWRVPPRRVPLRVSSAILLLLARLQSTVSTMSISATPNILAVCPLTRRPRRGARGRRCAYRNLVILAKRRRRDNDAGGNSACERRACKMAG